MCRHNAEPVHLLTGEQVAWLCTRCDASWHVDEPAPPPPPAPDLGLIGTSWR